MRKSAMMRPYTALRGAKGGTKTWQGKAMLTCSHTDEEVRHDAPLRLFAELREGPRHGKARLS